MVLLSNLKDSRLKVTQDGVEDRWKAYVLRARWNAVRRKLTNNLLLEPIDITDSFKFPSFFIHFFLYLCERNENRFLCISDRKHTTVFHALDRFFSNEKFCNTGPEPTLTCINALNSWIAKRNNEKSPFLSLSLFCLFVYLSPTRSWHARVRVRARANAHAHKQQCECLRSWIKSQMWLACRKNPPLKILSWLLPFEVDWEIARIRGFRDFFAVISPIFRTESVKSWCRAARIDRTRCKDRLVSWRHGEWRGLNSPLDFPLFGVVYAIHRQWDWWEGARAGP